MKNSNGLLIVISGFSGVGKGKAMKRLLEKYDSYALSVSATTREPRAGEAEGREYFFKSVAEFEQMIADNMLIEYANYVGNYYGTPREYVENQMQAGNDVILEIEIQGALNIKRQYPDAVLLFIVPPDAKTLRDRLVGRGTESEEVINARLARASQEAMGMEDYDYIVVNDKLEQCVDDIHAIVVSEKKRTGNSIALINKIREDLNRFSKGE